MHISGPNIKFLHSSTAYQRGKFPTEHGRACRHVILGPGIYPHGEFKSVDQRRRSQFVKLIYLVKMRLS